jgi:hypothetical protein
VWDWRSLSVGAYMVCRDVRMTLEALHGAYICSQPLPMVLGATRRERRCNDRGASSRVRDLPLTKISVRST